MRPPKVWQYPKDPLRHKIPNKRLKGVTLFGAIGSSMTKPVFMTGYGTTKGLVCKFIELAGK